MKKSLVLVLLFSGTINLQADDDFFENLGKEFDKGVKTLKEGSSKAPGAIGNFFAPVTKPVEKKVKAFIKDPGKVIKEDAEKLGKDLEKAGKEVLKFVGGGTDLQAVTKSVEAVKSAVGEIQSDVNAVNTAFNAPSSPMVKAPIIGEKLKQFQIKSSALMKAVAVEDLKSSLANPQALAGVIVRVVSPSTQADVKKLYGMYDSILAEIDSVDIKPIASSLRATLLDAAKIVDSARDVIINSGKLVEGVVGDPIMDSIESISSDLKAMAGDLKKIADGGMLKARQSQGTIAVNVLTNLNKIMPLANKMPNVSAEITPKIQAIMTIVGKINTEVATLQSTATGIGPKLDAKTKKQTKTAQGTLSIPQSVIADLDNSVKSLRASVNRILLGAVDAVEILSQVMASGVEGIDDFQKAIKFSLLPPASHAGFEALPKHTKKLAQSIDQFRVAIKKK
jgi:hypothetical protein